jgi:hypothetical protein
VSVHHRDSPRLAWQQVFAYQDVVDQLFVTPVRSRVAASLRDQWGQVKKPGIVALVRPVEASSPNLTSRRSLQQLCRRGVGHVIEVTKQDQRTIRIPREQLVRSDPERYRLGGAPQQRQTRDERPLVLVSG